MTTKRTVSISGIIGGEIWMPGCVCAKTFHTSDDQYPFTSLINQDRANGSRPSLREN